MDLNKIYDIDLHVELVPPEARAYGQYKYRVLGKDLNCLIHHTNDEADARAFAQECIDAWIKQMQELSFPNECTYWTHYKGTIYKVLHVGNEFATNHLEDPIYLVYQSLEDNPVWVKPLTDWHRSMTYLSDSKPAE